MAGRGAQSAPRAPQRGRSQHFLRNRALAEAIVRHAGVTGDDIVVDIGAGSGRLTAPLAERAAHVFAVELDPVFAERLRRRFAGRENVTVIEADAISVPLPANPFRVLANLPFSGANAIIRRLLGHGSALQRADVILEWDAARKRSSCWPSTMSGVCWGARYELALVRRLPAACFEPPPAVDAGLLRIARRDATLVADRDYAEFCRFVRAGFRSDRPLRASLRGRAFKRMARELGLTGSARARDLDVHQWVAVFGAVRSPRGSRGLRIPEGEAGRGQ